MSKVLQNLLTPKNVATVGGGVIDYLQRRKATNNAVGSLTAGATAAQGRLDPYAAAGRQGLEGMRALSDPATAGTFLENTPGYAFGQEEGRKQLVRTAAAKRQLLSGGTLKALTRYGQDYASTKLGEEFDRNATMANLGLNATMNQAQIEQDIGSAIAAGDFERAGELSKLIGMGIDVAGDIFGGGGSAAGVPGGVVPPGAGGAVGTAIKSGIGSLGKAVGTAGKVGGTAVAKGAVTAGKALAGAIGAIPLAGQIALGVGAAVLAGKKIFGIGNTHEKADAWVKGTEKEPGGFQNRFDEAMASIDQETAGGTLTPEQAMQAKSGLLREYVTEARKFAGRGSDHRRVIDNAFRTMREQYGPVLQQSKVAGYIDVPQSIKAQGWF